MMAAKKQPAPAKMHRSRQKVPFQRREHLHDGLRMMVADVPREHGWLIQRTTTNVLIQEADECEDQLYKGVCAETRCFLCAVHAWKFAVRTGHVA